jgi:hypothetical protein
LQAALLDVGCAATLSQLLARLLPAAADPAKAANAGALTTMALEVITVLSNPEVCLNPDLDIEQRAVEECVAPNEVSALAGMTKG